MIKGSISVTALCHYLFVTLICMNLSSLTEKILNDFYRWKNINLFAAEKKTKEFPPIGEYSTKAYIFSYLLARRSAENKENINFYQATRSSVSNSFWE